MNLCMREMTGDDLRRVAWLDPEWNADDFEEFLANDACDGLCLMKGERIVAYFLRQGGVVVRYHGRDEKHLDKAFRDFHPSEVALPFAKSSYREIFRLIDLGYECHAAGKLRVRMVLPMDRGW